MKRKVLPLGILVASIACLVLIAWNKEDPNDKIVAKLVENASFREYQKRYKEFEALVLKKADERYRAGSKFTVYDAIALRGNSTFSQKEKNDSLKKVNWPTMNDYGEITIPIPSLVRKVLVEVPEYAALNIDERTIVSEIANEQLLQNNK